MLLTQYIISHVTHLFVAHSPTSLISTVPNCETVKLLREVDWFISYSDLTPKDETWMSSRKMVINEPLQFYFISVKQ